MSTYILYVYKSSSCGACVALNNSSTWNGVTKPRLGEHGVVVVELNDGEVGDTVNITKEDVQIPDAEYKFNSSGSIPEFVLAEWDTTNHTITKIQPLGPHCSNCGEKNLYQLMDVYPVLKEVITGKQKTVAPLSRAPVRFNSSSSDASSSRSSSRSSSPSKSPSRPSSRPSSRQPSRPPSVFSRASSSSSSVSSSASSSSSDGSQTVQPRTRMPSASSSSSSDFEGAF